MTSSAKKKKEKKKDFQVCLLIDKWTRFNAYCIQKAKLKVGKTKPKASNYTDTSFKSKGSLSTP